MNGHCNVELPMNSGKKKQKGEVSRVNASNDNKESRLSTRIVTGMFLFRLFSASFASAMVVE